MSFGYTLRRIREARGMKIRRLAELSQMGELYIHRLECDDGIEPPCATTVGYLLGALRPSSHQALLLRLMVGKEFSHNLIDLFFEDRNLRTEFIYAAYYTSKLLTMPPKTKYQWRRHVADLVSWFEATQRKHKGNFSW